MLHKPLVILMPKAERETLRECGTLPPGFFRAFGSGLSDSGSPSSPVSSLYLWEHEIDYRRSAELAARAKERPTDIAVFLGMPDSANDDQKQAHEIHITHLLDSVMVHIVFLDNREQEGRGYAQFRSFSEIEEWSRHFNEVLAIRFPNEAALRSRENVLVIVARGEQVKVSNQELEAFHECIGELKAFKSCYFLDYNLSMGPSAHLFHSAAVWNVMVGRLLLGFLLSHEHGGNANSTTKLWMRPGIKIWRAAECRADVPARFLEQQTRGALSAAYRKIEALVDSGKQEPLDFGNENPMPDLKIDDVVPGENGVFDLPPGGWSEFPAEAIAGEVASPKWWTSALKSLRDSVKEWRQKIPAQANQGAEQVAKGVERAHEEPGQLYTLTAALVRALGLERETLKGSDADALEQKWREVAELEQARLATLQRADHEARELRRAQDHYVGLGFGLVIVASVCVLCGWLISQLVVALGGGLAPTIILASAMALGSIGVFCLVHYLHWRHGLKGVEAFTQTCKDADGLMKTRQDRVKGIVNDALAARARWRRLNRRFRAWLLLERIKAVLTMEIQPAAARVGHLDESQGQNKAPLEDSADARREIFIGFTRKLIGSLATDHQGATPDYEQEVDRWWGKPKGNNENFLDLWRQLCRQDKYRAGHFPVALFIPAIREFVSRFTARIQSLAVTRVIAENQDEVKAELLKWVREDVLNSPVRQFFSGSISGEHDCETGQHPGLIYIQNKEQELGIPELKTAIESVAMLHRYELLSSSSLESAGPLGFLYQEFLVKFCRNEETGHLSFQGVQDG